MTILAAVGIAILLVTGCTPAAYPEFEREQTEQDVVDAEAALGVVPETTRYVGEVGDARFYIARPADRVGVCLLEFDGGKWLGASCGGEGGVGSTFSDGIQVEVGDYRFPPEQANTGERLRLSESVVVILDE